MKRKSKKETSKEEALAAEIPTSSQAAQGPAPSSDQLANKLIDKKIPLSDLDIENQNYIKDMINEQIRLDIEDQKKLIKKYKDVSVLKAIISEYMQSFVLIGYDVNGNRINVKSTGSDMDNDALLEQFRAIFMDLINNGH